MEDEKSEEKSESRLSSEVKKLISIEADHLLNVTLTKSTLDLFQRISTMFNDAYRKDDLISDIDDEQAMLAIVNQTGVDLHLFNIQGIEVK